MIRLLLAFGLLLTSSFAYSQLSGTTNPPVTTTHTYTYYNGVVNTPQWSVTPSNSGTVTPITANGVYQATITWNTVGNATITLKDGGVTKATQAITVGPPPPDAPTANAASNITVSSFTANWSSVTGAIRYHLDVATASDFNFSSRILSDAWVDGTSRTITGLDGGKKYYYQVRTEGSNGISNNSLPREVLTLSTAPTASAATNKTASSFTANWSGGSTSGNYLDVSTSQYFGTCLDGYKDRHVTGNSLTISSSQMQPGTNYYYRLRSVPGENSSTNGNWINVQTIPDAPLLFNPGSVTANSFVVSVVPPAGNAVKYRLDVSRNSQFTQILSAYSDEPFSGTNTSYTVQGLDAGTTYYYRVRGYNDSGTSASTQGEVLTIPPVPSFTTTSNVTSSSLTLNWIPAAGATSYFLYLYYYLPNSSNPTYVYNGLEVTGNSKLVNGLFSGVTYYYQLRAKNNSGTSGFSLTKYTTLVPPKPTVNEAFGVKTTQFTASWNPALGATKYRIDVSPFPDFNIIRPEYNNLDVGNTTTAIVAGLNGGTTLYYRVRAENDSGTSASSEYMTVDLPPPIPIGLNTTNITDNSFTANWTPSSTATGYIISVATNPTFTNLIISNEEIPNVTSYTPTVPMQPGATYYYRVRASNDYGTSPSSVFATALLKPAAPTGIATSDPKATSFTASWHNMFGASSYLLDVSLYSGFNAFENGYKDREVTSNSEVVAGLSAGQTYYFRVRAANASGTSTYSTNGKIILPPEVYGATSITATSFKANWKAATTATSYQLDVSNSNTFAAGSFVHQDLSVNTNSSTVEGLSPGTKYFYRVQTVNSGPASVESDTISLYTLCHPPIISLNTNITSSSFTANWLPAAGATTYRLDVSGSPSFDVTESGYSDIPVNGTSQEVNGLDANTKYFFRVRAVNKAGVTSANSTNGEAITAPEVPTPLSATNVSDISFTANWNASAGASSYLLDVARDINFTDYVQGYLDRPVSSQSASVIGLAQGTTYFYRITASNGPGKSIESDTVAVTTLCSAPVIASASNITPSSFVAKWQTNTCASSYRVDVAYDENFNQIHSSYNDVSSTTNSLLIDGLNEAGRTYFYRVRCVSANRPSANSNPTGSVTLLPIEPPRNLRIILVAEKTTSIAWDVVPEASSYELDVSPVPDFNSFVSGYQGHTVNTASDDINLPSAGIYFVRVRTKLGSAFSVYSPVLEIGSNHNFVKSTAIVTPGASSISSIEELPSTDRVITYQFFDGLGRPLQNVSQQSSPDGHDVVQPFEYDAFGRESKQYLAYVSSEQTGWIKENAVGVNGTDYLSSPQYNFYQNSNDKVADDLSPYAQHVFESSPLNRPVKVGAPGVAWQPDVVNNYTSTDKTVKKSYQLNSIDEVQQWTIVSAAGSEFGLIATNNTYLESSLLKNVTKDEHGNDVIEYVNAEGQVILKRVQALHGDVAVNDVNYASTYYIYDDMGNLVCVVPPEAVRLIPTLYTGKTDAVKEDFLENWAFRYKYDNKRRLSQKQVPGAAPVYMVYDNRDRLVLTQDGNQRTGSPYKWTFTKYDMSNRPVLTGLKDTTANLSQVQMQTVVDSFYTKGWMRSGEEYIGEIIGNVHGYSNKTYPIRTTGTTTDLNSYLTVSYYDDYTFKQSWPTEYNYVDLNLSGSTNATSYSQPDTENIYVNGQVTGGKIKVLDNATGADVTWLKTVNYYDDQYRPIQSVSSNYKSGYDRLTTLFDFTSKVLKTSASHQAVIGGETVVRNTLRKFDYDHAGRLLRTWHSIDEQPEILLSENEYNELGQLVDKNLHKDAAEARQSVDYRYNIRGWLTSINNARLSIDQTNDDTDDFFGMDLDYNESEQISLTGNQNTIAEKAISNYQLDGNSNDSGSADKDGTIIGAIPTVDRFGTPSKAYSFNGTSQYISLPGTESSHNFIQNTGVFTISAYIRLTDLNSRNIILGSSATIAYKGFVLMYETLAGAGNHQLRFTVYSSSSYMTARGAEYTINDTNWHHVAVVGDGKYIRFYVDGKPDGNATKITVFSTGNSQNPIKLGISGNYNSSFAIGLNGAIDDVQIYNQALPFNEIESLSENVTGGAQYNGNISSIRWSNNIGLSDVKSKQYSFSYDAMNRLTNASYREGSIAGTLPDLNWSLGNEGKFKEGGLTYDLNGNIQTLTRTDQHGNTIDQLDYNYGASTTASNKLLIVRDLADHQKGFTEVGDPAGNDYTYDANGNLVFDRNKGGKDVVKNGSFDEGNSDWLVGEEASRITFADSLVYFTLGTSRVTLTQNGIIKPNMRYIVVLDYERISGSGNISVSVNGRGTVNLLPGINVFNDIAGGTANGYIKLFIPAGSEGIIKAIQVKALVSIGYNHLNLPEIVTKGDESINYIYDATGRKLAQLVYKNTTVTKRSDYAGEYFYENDTLKFINHEEGRIVMTGPSPEYQYHLKDHLGNVRLTFTTKTDIEQATATLENSAESNEFLNYDEAVKISSSFFDHTNRNGTGSRTSTRLVGGNSNEIYGLAKSLSVMPGDTISMEVYAKYLDTNPANWSQPLSDLMTQVTAKAPQVFIDGGAAGSLGTQQFPFEGYIARSETETGPKAYLNYIIFNREFVPLDFGYVQVPASAKESGDNAEHAKLTINDIVVTEPGYVYIYLSNENETEVEVYFDDFGVEHIKGAVIQTEDYYPFGLTFNSHRREYALQNRYLFNQGSGEKTFLTERVFDLGLNIDLTKYRVYDPTTGRWWQVDPLADLDELITLTPYNYSYNNPIRFNDPYGDCSTCPPPAFIPAIGVGVALVEGAVALLEGATIVAGTTAVVAGLSVFGGQILEAMGTVSPYSSPGVDAAQSTGGVKTLNMDKARSASDQKLIEEALKKKAKEDGARARTQSRQNQTQQGKNKEGKSNKETRGNHDSGNKSKASKQDHENANARRAREQAKADKKKEESKKRN